jgi:hypothetical protein
MSDVVDFGAARARRAPIEERVDYESDGYDYEFDIAVEHIRKGWYGDEDLRIAGITREQADEYLRRDIIARLARSYDEETLRAALKLKVREKHDPHLNGYLDEAWPNRPGVWS